MDKWIHGVSPDDRTCEVAQRTLDARCGAVQHYLPLAAEKAEEDPEYVHELRTWTQRAAAALKVYADFLPHRRVEWVKKQLKRIRRAANDARDYDVLAHRLTKECSNQQPERLLAKVRAQRRKAQEPLVALYERLKRNDGFQRRIAKLLRRVRSPGKGTVESKDQRFENWAKRKLPPIVKKFFEAVPTEDGADGKVLHRFRIRGKKLRYAMELLAGAFPVRFREALYPIIETLQDKLGEINDLTTGQIHLRRIIETADNAAEVSHLQRLLGEAKAHLEQSRQAFLGWYTPQVQKALRAEFDGFLTGPAHGLTAPDRRSRTRFHSLTKNPKAVEP
jgi:CHAD domain-containing protein